LRRGLLAAGILLAILKRILAGVGNIN